MRAHLSKPIVDASGNIQVEEPVLVRVLDPDSEDLISATLYQDSAGVSFYPNPVTITNGVLDFYLADPARVRLGVIIGEEPEEFHEDVDVLMPGLPNEPPTVLYLRSPDDTVWAITVDDDGVLHTDDGVLET